MEDKEPIPPTTNPNLVTGDASNKIYSPTTATTNETTPAAAAAAAIDGEISSTRPGLYRATENTHRAIFPPTNTADEAAIGNDETEQSKSDVEPNDASDADPNDQHNSNNA